MYFEIRVAGRSVYRVGGNATIEVLLIKNVYKTYYVLIVFCDSQILFTPSSYYTLSLVDTFDITCAFSQKVVPIAQIYHTPLIMVALPHCENVKKFFFFRISSSTKEI